MINQGYWMGGVTHWIYLLVLGALAIRVLYLYFTARARKSSRNKEADNPNGSSGTLIDNDRTYADQGGAEAGDGGGDGGGGD